LWREPPPPPPQDRLNRRAVRLKLKSPVGRPVVGEDELDPPHARDAPPAARPETLSFGPQTDADARCLATSASAIWTALSAAPLRSWSPHTQKLRAFSALSSSRILPT
jgi:hypothetical protein